MEQILDTAKTIYEGEIDFTGQKLAEYITYGLLTLVGIIAFFAGFVTQDIYQTVYIGLGGTAVAFLVVVPPWPFFNQKPQPWLPARTGSGAWQGVNVEVDGRKIK